MNAHVIININNIEDVVHVNDSRSKERLLFDRIYYSCLIIALRVPLTIDILVQTLDVKLF